MLLTFGGMARIGGSMTLLLVDGCGAAAASFILPLTTNKRTRK